MNKYSEDKYMYWLFFICNFAEMVNNIYNPEKNMIWKHMYFLNMNYDFKTLLSKVQYWTCIPNIVNK